MRALCVALLAVTLIFAPWASSDAFADSGFRCASGKLVSVGDHLSDVRGRCGEPDYADQRIERRKVSRRVRSGNASIEEEQWIEITIDEWTYDLGNNRFVRRLLFENSRLVHVSTGKRGTKPAR
jgi:hypothetical protein